MSTATETLAQVAAGDESETDTEPLEEGEAREFAKLLLSEQHTKPEIQAFFYAWDGSINFQQEHGSPAMADAAMSLGVFQQIFGHLTQSCRVPSVGEGPPTNPITELRETAEIAFHQGYKVRDKAKTEEALTSLVTGLLQLFGASPQFNWFFQQLDTVKRAAEIEDWESGTAHLLAVLVSLREAEASMVDQDR
jgi:hypothetical protein